MASNKYLTFAAVIVVVSIANVHSTPLEDEIENRHTHILIGKRESGDFILRDDKIEMSGEAGKIQEYTITAIVDDHTAQKISMIKVENKGMGKDRGIAKIAAGGLGDKSVKFDFTSELHGGIIFDVMVYGAPK